MKAVILFSKSENIAQIFAKAMAYEAGMNCGTYGANPENSHPRHFTSLELTEGWKAGYLKGKTLPRREFFDDGENGSDDPLPTLQDLAKAHREEPGAVSAAIIAEYEARTGKQVLECELCGGTGHGKRFLTECEQCEGIGLIEV